MSGLVELGLGLDRDAIALVRTTASWIAAGDGLRRLVLRALDGVTTHVEVIGSAAVEGLLSKPILDLAVGLIDPRSLASVVTRLAADGWIHRGDAGAQGGHVLVLERRPGHRVAHLHVVELDGAAWRRYLRLRDVLRADPEARRRYEAVKLALVAAAVPLDRRAYMLGKSEVVASLLREQR